jgi:hypothetical protein
MTPGLPEREPRHVVTGPDTLASLE